MADDPSPPNALHELIRRRREELGSGGRPVTFDWLAERSGLPMATVHALATRPVRSLRSDTRVRLEALARALDVDPVVLEQAAVEALGYSVRVEYREPTEDHEVLIGAYDDLDEDRRRQVLDYARFLREQRRS